ncbi:hypothetical protein MMC28_008100 [Mycoblastus sanguinarius]|nr:hypothetical protein [Mycoblastus sanguinarius]
MEVTCYLCALGCARLASIGLRSGLITAEEVGRVIRTHLSAESPLVGIIQAAPRGSDTSAEFPNIVSWKLESRGEVLEELEPGNAITGQTSRVQKTTLEFFESYFGRWRQDALATNLGEVDVEVELYDDLLKVAREMDDLRLFKPDLNCLCHLDLHPRNIMVKIEPDSSLKVTAILDWDEAVIAPKFVNCQPPGWLWGYDKDTHVDEDDLLPWPYELPSTLEQQELKRIFEEYAGPDYPRLAYDESSRFIRGLFRLATLGLTASWHFTAAERIVKEWKALRPSLAHES